MSYNPSPKKGFKRIYAGGRLQDVPIGKQKKNPMTMAVKPKDTDFYYPIAVVQTLLGLAAMYFPEGDFCRIQTDLMGKVFVRISLDDYKHEDYIGGLMFDVDEESVSTALTDDVRVYHNNPNGKAAIEEFLRELKSIDEALFRKGSGKKRTRKPR